MSKLTYRISYYALYAMFAIILIVIGLFFLGGDASGDALIPGVDPEMWQPAQTDALLYLMYALFGIAIAATLVAAVFQFGAALKDSPAAAIKSLLGLVLLNIAALAVFIIFGCHNPFMFNQSTLVLGYLLLYGYDVTGKSYQMRLAAMVVGALLTCLVFFRNHKNRTYKRTIKDIIREFDITSSRTKWQLCQILCVPTVLFIAQVCKMPRAMWAGIAAMSAIVPFMEDMQYRVRKRIIGNIAGVICFVALYYLLPPSIYAYIGIIGGIGVGFSVKYGWQAVFNTFGALAIAAQTYGLKGAVSLRVIQNVFGVAFALVFCILFYWMMSKSCKLASNQV